MISRPIDLRTIKEKIHSYSSMSEFLADIRLMFQNCATFNRVCIIQLYLFLFNFCFFV